MVSTLHFLLPDINYIHKQCHASYSKGANNNIYSFTMFFFFFFFFFFSAIASGHGIKVYHSIKYKDIIS